METPLTPLEFARRTRTLYSNREALVDGALRLTYAQFFERCDRWSAALQRLGVCPGDRVAYIAPNTHAQLESFYAVPQIGRRAGPHQLPSQPRRDRLHHHAFGMRPWSARTRITLTAVDSVRDQLAGVRHFVALEGKRDGLARLRARWWPTHRRTSRGRRLAETDLLTINYTSGTTSRPKGVMITHRNAYMNAVGTLLHVPMGLTDRYLWTLPMFHANGWTFTWIVTAVGGGARLPAQGRSGASIRADRRGTRHGAVRRTDGAHRHRQRVRRAACPDAAGRSGRDRRGATRRRHDRAHRGRTRLDHHARLRTDGDGAVHHDLRAAARARSAGAGGTRGHQSAAGRRADHVRRTARGGRATGATCRTTAPPSARSSCAATSS